MTWRRSNLPLCACQLKDYFTKQVAKSKMFYATVKVTGHIESGASLTIETTATMQQEKFLI